MSPILVRQDSPTSTEVGEWSVPDHATFIQRVLDRAHDRRMQAPFLIAAPLSEDLAAMLSIPSLAGSTGAMILYDDGTTRFVPAPAGALIVSGSGRTESDTETARVEICRQWLERVDRCHVELRLYAAPTNDAVARWRAAEDAQDAALAAAVADATPANIAALAAATDARHAAYIQLPPYPNAGL